MKDDSHCDSSIRHSTWQSLLDVRWRVLYLLFSNNVLPVISACRRTWPVCNQSDAFHYWLIILKGRHELLREGQILDVLKLSYLLLELKGFTNISKE